MVEKIKKWRHLCQEDGPVLDFPAVVVTWINHDNQPKLIQLFVACIVPPNRWNSQLLVGDVYVQQHLERNELTCSMCKTLRSASGIRRPLQLVKKEKLCEAGKGP